MGLRGGISTHVEQTVKQTDLIHHPIFIAIVFLAQYVEQTHKYR